jgi:hypothetical protein
MLKNGRLAIFSVVVGCCVAASCSSGSATSTSTSASTTPATSSPATMSTGFFGGAHSAACETDLQQMQTTVESYLALNGGTEVTEAELVQQGLLREESVLHDIGPGATVIPSPTGGCLS